MTNDNPFGNLNDAIQEVILEELQRVRQAAADVALRAFDDGYQQHSINPFSGICFDSCKACAIMYFRKIKEDEFWKPV